LVALLEDIRARKIGEILKTSLKNLVQRSIASSFHPVPVYGARASNRFFVVAQQPAATSHRHTPTRGSNGILLRVRPHPRQRRPSWSSAIPEIANQLTLARRVIARRIPILLHGETGVGKEVFALALHRAARIPPAILSPSIARRCRKA
jgi:transcriptional regulator of acetoin/glycerol metabolism